MNEKDDRHTIAVYVRYYLSPSETFVHRQLQGVSSGFDPIVITSSVTNRDLFPVEHVYPCAKGLAGKIHGRLVQKMFGRYGWATGKQRSYWRQILAKNKVRLIHSHFGHFALDILPVARSLGIPLLVTFHGVDASQMLNDRAYTDALKPLFEYAHAITVSRNMLERLTKFGLDPGRTDVHYIGVPVENFEFTDRTPVRDKLAGGEPLLFVQVSNFVEKKGHRYTIEAFAEYSKNHAAHRLVLAGDGPLRESMQEMCRSLGIDDRVEFPGKVVREEVSDLMRSADVFLHHSVTSGAGDMEGLPTVLMEAMSTGLVVITTRHSGIPELVEDGKSGYLVDERDVDGYLQKLTDLKTTDYNMGRLARRAIEGRFNMSRQNLELQRIYAKIIAGRKPAAEL